MMNAISSWPATDASGLFDFVTKMWNHEQGWVVEDGRHIWLIPGDSFKNKQIIQALDRNQLITSLCRRESDVVGEYMYEWRVIA